MPFIRTSVVLGLVMAVAVGIARADLLEYEGFDYSGTTIDGQNGGSGWGSAWDDGDGDFARLSNDDISLDSAAFPFTPIGDRIEGAGGAARRYLNTTIDLGEDGNVMYFSALLRKNSLDALASEDVSLDFFGNDGAHRRFRFGLTSDDQFMVEAASTGASTTGTVLADTTYFMVVKLVSHSTTDDEAFLKVYAPGDTVDSSEPGSWTLTDGGGTSVNIDVLELTLGSGFSESGAIDEIRIGETWADVTSAATVPEPSSLLILISGGLGLALLARRRRR